MCDGCKQCKNIRVMSDLPEDIALSLETLHEGLEPGTPEAAAINALESMVLAQQRAGFDIDSQAYREALATTLDALANNLPDETLPAGVVPMVDASTAHLSPSDIKLLDHMAARNQAGFPRTVSHDYGWTLFLPELLDDEDLGHLDPALGASEELSGLIYYAMVHGAYILNLDADAEPIPDIKCYAENPCSTNMIN